VGELEGEGSMQSNAMEVPPSIRSGRGLMH